MTKKITQLPIALTLDGSEKIEIVQSESSRQCTAQQIANLASTSIGFTPEDVSNKDIDGTLSSNSDIKYPSQKASKTYADTKQAISEKDATGGYVGLTLYKINFKNALNTFTSFFTNSNTASRTYTFQDRNGTMADDTDIALLETKLDASSITTSGSTITLDFASKRQRIFNGATSFTGSKTIALSNSSNALVFTFNFQVTGSGAALTFPVGFKSSDTRFSGLVLTLTGAGYYEVTATFDSVNSIWRLKSEIDGGVI